MDTMKIKDFLALPCQDDFYSKKEFDGFLIVPTKKMHNSGYRLFAVIGYNYVDDVPALDYLFNYDVVMLRCNSSINIDMMENNIIRIFGVTPRRKLTVDDICLR